MPPPPSPLARMFRSVARTRALALVLASALLASSATAQSVHVVRVGLGYAHHAVLDTAASSLAYDGHLASSSLTYQGDSPDWRWTARLNGRFGHLERSVQRGRVVRFQSQHPDGTVESVSVPMRAQSLGGGASVRVARVLAWRRAQLLVGADVTFVMTYVQGFVAPGLMQSLSIGPTLGARTELSRGQRLELSAHTVLGAWVTRMPYDQTVSAPGQTPYQGLVARGSGFRSVHRLQTLALDASYQRDVGARAAIRGSVGLEWLHDARPRPLRVLDASLELSLAVRIGGPT